MASTIDSISHGRFGVNIVSGWAKDEYEQMGLWPARPTSATAMIIHRVRDGDEGALGDRHVRFQGQVLPDVGLQALPSPEGPIKIVSAGQTRAAWSSGRPTATTTSTRGKGVNTPTAHAPTNQLMVEAAAKTGRDVGNYVLMMVIADETDEKAMAKWKLYNEGADLGAMAWIVGPGRRRSQRRRRRHGQAHLRTRGGDQLQHGTLVGSYASVAKMLDECATVPGTKGIMLTFDDFPGRHGSVRPAHPAAHEVPQRSARKGGGLRRHWSARSVSGTYLTLSSAPQDVSKVARAPRLYPTLRDGASRLR